MNLSDHADRPADEAIQAMVDRVQPDVLRMIRKKKQRRRRLSIAGIIASAALMFGAGLATAAAAIPHLPGAQYGTTLSADGHVVPALFSIGCYQSSTDSNPSMTWTENSEPLANAARRNPAAACAAMQTMTATSKLIASEAASLESTGVTCGSIDVRGGATYSWAATTDATGAPALSFSNSNPPSSAACGGTVEIAAPAPTSAPTAVCAVTPNIAAVYPSLGNSDSTVCAAVGEEPWK
jgi:hypothetical protein